MRYTTLGHDVLDTSDYSIIATAKTDEIANNIASAMNTAQQSAGEDVCHCNAEHAYMTYIPHDKDCPARRREDDNG